MDIGSKSADTMANAFHDATALSSLSLRRLGQFTFFHSCFSKVSKYINTLILNLRTNAVWVFCPT